TFLMPLSFLTSYPPIPLLFVFTPPPPPQISPLSLHDALPIFASAAASRTRRVRIGLAAAILPFHHPLRLAEQMALVDIISQGRRSEEHTSELQSLTNLVCRLLLEKKKKTIALNSERYKHTF